LEVILNETKKESEASLLCKDGGNREAYCGPQFDAICVKHWQDKMNGRIRPWAWKVLEANCKESH
jgi:hypothetical protein